MNPLDWKREHQIAFLIAALIGASMGLYIGVRQVEPSIGACWLHVGVWGGAGTVLAAFGAYIRQLIRSRNSGKE